MSEEINPYAAPESDTVLAGSLGSDQHSPYGGMRDTRALGRGVQVLLWTQVALMLMFSLVNLFVGLKASDSINVFVASDGITESQFSTGYMSVAGILLIVYILTIIFFCIWTNKSMKNAWALREYSRFPEITPGWAVGYYFIPILNLWKPYQGMRQIWDLSVTDQKRGPLLLWWWFWIIGGICDRISNRLPVVTLDELAFSSYFGGGTILVSVVAAILLIKIVGRVTCDQMEHFKIR